MITDLFAKHEHILESAKLDAPVDKYMGEDDVFIDHFFANRALRNYGQNHPNLYSTLVTLFRASREGHLCVYLDSFEQLPDELLKRFLVQEGNRLYLRRNWMIEQSFIQEWERLKKASPQIVIPASELEQELCQRKLQYEQKEAILRAAASSISLITGGPGTGKSYTAVTLIRLFSKWMKTIYVTAPTGKATANLREKLLEEPCMPIIHTLHALMKKKYQFSADLILVDEASMVDAKTFSELFSCIKSGARVILLGDQYQLPPVESGNFFSDLLGISDDITELTVCLRAEIQDIVNLGKAVKHGQFIPFFPLPTQKEIVKTFGDEISALDFQTLDEAFSYFQKKRVLTPLRKGPYGVEVLNDLFHKEHLRRKKHPLIPILITKNDSHLSLYNGDVGLLDPNHEMAFFYGQRNIPSFLLPSYEFAYCLSIHKSQGSEYNEVEILLPEGSEKFGREMLYTAVTRAKKIVKIFSKKEILETVLGQRTKRLSGIMDYNMPTL